MPLAPEPSSKGFDLIIVDSEFLFAEQILDTYLDQLISAAQSFESLCTQVRQWAITESEICGVLEGLESDMAVVRMALTELSSTLTGRSEAFVGHINDLDSFVY